jgi:DNA modification methylase
MPKRSTKKKTAPKAPQKSGGSGATGKQPLALLRADPKNARKISKQALAGLGVSMTEFGDLSGITWNEKLGDLVAGHQRMKRLGSAGARSWERTGPDTGVVVDPKTKERFPVRIVQWDETKHRLAQIAANNPAIQGDFTEETLEQLRELETDARYHELRLQDLAAQLQGEADEAGGDPGGGDTDPDDAVEPPAKAITKTGDLWILGSHRLLCGDSTKPDQVTRLMDGHRAALMATDPPYGVDYNGVKKGIPKADGAAGRFKDWGDIENDVDPKGTEEILRGFLAAAQKVLGDAPGIYVWHPANDMQDVFRREMVTAGLLVHRQIIWVKPAFVFSRQGMYHLQHEPCFFGWRKGNIPPWYEEKNQASVWNVGRDDGKSVHPTQKPVELFEIPMRNHTREGEVCFEPFSGSGSQIIAGERMRRRVYAMELSPRWCDAAVARWEAFTGKKAHRADAPPSPPRKKPTKAPPAPEVTNG